MIARGITCEQQLVSDVLSTLRAKVNVTGVCEGDVPAEIPTEQLPYTWLTFAVEGEPIEWAVGYVQETLRADAVTLFEFDCEQQQPNGTHPMHARGRELLGQQMAAMKFDETRGNLGVMFTNEGERSIEETSIENIGAARMSWRIVYSRLRDNPYAFDGEQAI